MSSDSLDSLTDSQLNDALSALLPAPEHNWVESRFGPDDCAHCGVAQFEHEDAVGGKPCKGPWWTSSSGEVLKLLSRLSPDWSSRTYGGETAVRLHFVGVYPGETFCGVGSTLARAGTIAAVRALRADLQRLAKESATGAICGRCKEPMRPNVPRLGWSGGAVHDATGRLECADGQMTPPPTPVATTEASP